MNTIINTSESKYIRPKTRGELLELLKKNVKCEVLTSNVEITSLILQGWGNFKNFKTYPSENPNWSVFELV